MVTDFFFHCSIVAHVHYIAKDLILSCKINPNIIVKHLYKTILETSNLHACFLFVFDRIILKFV